MKPTVFWITGVPGSGKTTLAKSLVAFLREHQIAAVWLDGDQMRVSLGESGNFTRQDRLRLARIYHRLANMIVQQGFTTVVSTVSLFHEVHSENRKNFESYFEVYLENDFEDQINGPRSHLHNQSSETNPFLNFEPPLSPDLVLSSKGMDRNTWSSELIRVVGSKFL